MENALTAPAHAVPAKSAEGIAAADFETLVRQHQRRIFRVLFLMVRDHDAADTLTQETFLRAYEQRAQFRGECPTETWLLKIAVNLARDWARNRRAGFWRRLIGWDHSQETQAAANNARDRNPSPEQMLIAREEVQTVWAAVDDLSGRQKAIFILYFAEEMALQEVAEVLGIETGTVKVHLFRALTAVRKKLGMQL